MKRVVTEKMKAKMKAYYHSHKPEARLFGIKWRAEHVEACKIIGHRRSRSLGGRFSSLKNAAKRKGRELTLTFEEYKELISQPCFYCNGPLAEAGYGLDRINNEQIYSYTTVHPCCETCNIAKSQMTLEQFKNWIVTVNNNLLRKGI